MEKKCGKIEELLQREAERMEVEKHCLSCDVCREFFREEASFKALYEKGEKERESVSAIPEKVDMAILSRAGFAAAERLEKRRRTRRILYAAASIAVVAFLIGLFSGSMDFSAGTGKHVAVRMQEKKVKNPSRGETAGSISSWEYTDYAEGNDAVNCELFSLSAQLDMAAFEAEIAEYRS